MFFCFFLIRTIEMERMKEANKSVKMKVHSRDLDQVNSISTLLPSISPAFTQRVLIIGHIKGVCT